MFAEVLYPEKSGFCPRKSRGRPEGKKPPVGSTRRKVTLLTGKTTSTRRKVTLHPEKSDRLAVFARGSVTLDQENGDFGAPRALRGARTRKKVTLGSGVLA